MAAAPTPQPFKNHPVQCYGRSVLGFVSAIAENVVHGTDQLLIGPPASSPNGVTAVEIGASILGTFRVTNAAGLLAADLVQLVYKAEGGREVVVAEVTGAVIAQGEKGSWNIGVECFLMSPTDIGLFARLVEAVPATGSFDCVVQAPTVRGPVRVATDVDAVEAIVAAGGNPANADTILESTEDGSVLVSIFGEENTYGVIHNYDSVAHTYQLFISNGTLTIEISDTDTPPSVAAGEMAGIEIPSLPPGWSALMSIGEAIVDFAPRVILGPSSVNLTPTRTNQGGAF